MSEQLLWLFLLAICGFFGLLGLAALAGFLFWRRRASQAQTPPRQRITRLKRNAPAPPPAGTIAVRDAAVNDMRAQHESPKTIAAFAPAESVYSLTALAGPYAGQTYSLTQFPARVGRAKGCAIALEADASVSRQQAEFYKVGAILRLRDLQSSHGTMVNGRSIDDIELHGGETIQVGDTTLRLGS